MSHNKTPLTGHKKEFSDTEFIISSTDTKGIITYCNKVCCEISGYLLEESVGQSHNLFRHPDMPNCIYQLLWDTITTGNEMVAYVINKCKNGDHYWVFAHVTPTYDEERKKIIGYLSSRRVAKKEIVEKIIPLYQQLRDEEEKHSNLKDSIEAGANSLNKILSDNNTTYENFITSL